MGQRIAVVRLQITLGLLIACSRVAASQTKWEMPFRWQENWMVVEASVGKLKGLEFMIDTGATHTIVDARIIRKLGLNPEPGEQSMVSFGNNATAREFLIADLRVGSIRTTLYCLEADLSGLGFDGVIGLDFLACRTYLANSMNSERLTDRNLTIDFRSNMILFSVPESFEHEAPFENDPFMIIVTATIQDRAVRMLVDTGAALSMLSNQRNQEWIRHLPIIGVAATYTLLSKDRRWAVRLPNLQIGTDKWKNLTAVVVEKGNSATDGILAVTRLGMKVLHLDFDNRLMSWK